MPPVHDGDATMTRNDPSGFGVKETCTCVELTTEAVTFWPPAVIAAIAPNVCPEEPDCELSAHVWARLPIAPDAAALGERPLHKPSVAVCRVPGLAPVTLTTSSSLPAGTQACKVMPPPHSSSTPLYRSSLPLKSDADVIAARPGICTCPGDSRLGMVSLRFSCAVNPPVPHAATPSEPLLSGRNCDGELFGAPSTTSERDTTPAVFRENAPFCQPVVRLAAAAGRLRLPVTSSDVARNSAAATNRNRRRGLIRRVMSTPWVFTPGSALSWTGSFR